ncbi:MAG: ABC transporter substrate-binding protein [Candidatus Onthomonas sp.]
MKKLISILLALVMVFSLAACGGGKTATEETDQGQSVPAINEITLSTKDTPGDYADLSAEIKILTNRTDVVDTVYAGYAQQFMELYPNIKVTYEAVTDYEESLTLRIKTGDWGDICFIPTSVAKDQLPNFFIPLGSFDDLDPIYNFVEDKTYGGQVYGIANGGTADGVLYNKAVWAEAGITEMPTTPEEFLEDLQQIKDNTDAIPLYTNFAAGWTMGAWDSYIWVAATGDPDFHSNIAHTANPFSDRGDQTGPYAVYYTLYEAVARKLIEDDPMSTDWESSKGRMNNGEIASMVLGSWAVNQMRDAGPNRDDIGYMPFPITVDGQRYAGAGGNYSYGINIKSSAENQIASLLYVKWLVEESPMFDDEGSIPALKSAPMPDVLEAFDGVTLMSNNPAPEGEETLFDEVNLQSECGLNNDDYPDAYIVEAALTGSQTLDEIMDEWNAKWTRAQETLGVEVNQ